MCNVCIVTEDGKKTWVDYSWLKSGCINEIYFNWEFGLLTAQDSNIRELNNNGAYRPFKSERGIKDTQDYSSHEYRFELIQIVDEHFIEISGQVYRLWERTI